MRSTRYVLAALMACPTPGIAMAASTVENVDFFVVGGALLGNGETTWTAESGFIYRPQDSRWGLGFAYTNDGHLTNNHRDGFVAQGWYIDQLSDTLELQVGTGPYASMNNTTVDGVRLNEFRVGLFTSAALKWYVLGNGWYLRSQWNHALVPRSFHSNALLFGLGYDFPVSEGTGSKDRPRADISVWGGTSRTTQLGPQDSSGAFQVEAQILPHQPFPWWPDGYSIAFLSEGNTGLADRVGIPVQAWWRTAPKTFTFSFGIGPYFARDAIREDSVNLLGIGSVRIHYAITESRNARLEAGFMFTRVASFYHRDQDIFMLGLHLYEKR